MVTDVPPRRVPLRRRRSLLALGAVAIVLLIFVGLWLVSPVHIDEPVPGTVKASGVVQVSRGKQGAPAQVRNLGAVRPGDILDVAEGGVAFLFFPGGVVGRVEGPAQVQVVESQRQVDAPSVVQGLLGQRAGADPLGKARIRTALALQVLSGTVAVKAASAKPNASVALRVGHVYGRVEGATVQVAVRSGGEVWWDTLEGAPVVGMVSGPPGEEASVVIPQAPEGLRLVTQAPLLAAQSPEEYGRLDASTREMADRLRRGAPAPKAGGLEYQEVTDPSGFAYLVSIRRETPAPATETFSAQSFEAPPVEEVLAVPGVEVRALRDADIQAYLPPGLSVHVLPGNTLRMVASGMTYTVRAAVVAGRLELQGLPFGIDPSPYFASLPALLSLETDEGVALVTYLPEETPPPPREQAAADTAPEGALPHAAEYFSSIPTPLQVSLDWNVAAFNILLVALLALVLRVGQGATAHILSGHEATLQRHFRPLLELWRPVASRLLALLRRVPHLLTTLAGSALALLVVNGALFAFLDVRFRPWEGRGLQVFPLMLLGMAVAGMVDPLVRARMLARLNVPRHFGFNPANLLLALTSVAVSRGLSLAPGLLLGSSGGLRASLQDLSPAQKGRLVAAGLAATLAVGLGAWLLTLVLPLAAGNPLSARFFQLFQGPLGLFQDMLLLAFTASLTKVFFSLLPVPNSPGLTVVSRYRLGWGVSFLVTGFLFFHLILNRNTGLTRLLQERGGLVIALVVVALAGTLVLYIVSRRMAKRAASGKP